jgi:citrate lyase subunit beta / citryl-CoA lyase
MRSLLFVPADSERKLARAPECGADALVLDLEDAVAADRKQAARRGAADFLKSRTGPRPWLHVRVNGLDSGMIEADLDAIVPARPDAIMLPKSEAGGDVALLSAMIAAREAIAGLDDGAIRIVAIATETPGAIFNFATYRGASPRLAGLAWSSEDLVAALGAETYYDDDGRLTDPFRLARSLCLHGAAHAAVAAIDRVFPNFRDAESLRGEARAAARDGFTAKLAIHPGQVPLINEELTPSPAAVDRARTIVAAFAAEPDAGVISLAGEMLDVPHLARAKAVLERAADAGLDAT